MKTQVEDILGFPIPIRYLFVLRSGIIRDYTAEQIAKNILQAMKDRK